MIREDRNGGFFVPGKLRRWPRARFAFPRPATIGRIPDHSHTSSGPVIVERRLFTFVLASSAFFMVYMGLRIAFDVRPPQPAPGEAPGVRPLAEAPADIDPAANLPVEADPDASAVAASPGDPG